MDDDDMAHTKMSWIDRYEHRNIEVNPELARCQPTSNIPSIRFQKQRNLFLGQEQNLESSLCGQDISLTSRILRCTKIGAVRNYNFIIHTPAMWKHYNRIDGEDIGWAAAYANCVLTCGGHDDDPLANEEDVDDEDGDEEEFEEPEEEEEIPRELRDWHELANRGPRTQLISAFSARKTRSRS